MKQYLKRDIKEMLLESNCIEGVYSKEALSDALESWDYAFNNKDKFDVPYILEIHRLLMQRQEPTIAGQFRDCDVWVGGQKRINLSPLGFNNFITSWCEDFKEQLNHLPDYSRENRERTMMWNHIKFENLHPFVDGNGRTGRILMNIQRYLFSLPILIIHEGDEQRDYYEWFR